MPIVATFGETKDEARTRAVDAIETALASMIDDGEDIPRPDGAAGENHRPAAADGPQAEPLLGLLRSTGITRAELARRLQWNRESVDQLFRLDHKSRLEQIEAAFAALGRVAELEVHEARAA